MPIELPMTQLNSSFQTALQRRYLPVVISMVLLGVIGAIWVSPAPRAAAVALTLAVLLMSALPYFCLYRAVVYRAADCVVLDGNMLRVTRGRLEMTIPVTSIVAIHSRTGVSPEVITLDVSTPGEFGFAISFIPPVRFPSGREHPVLERLRAAMGCG